MSEQDVLDKLDDILDKISDNKKKLAKIEKEIKKDKILQALCPHCGGTGQKLTDDGSIDCPDCGGDGVRPFGKITNQVVE